MEKELRAEDLFNKKTVETKVSLTDPEYEVIVKLSSVGKLGLPAVLHVRDYSFDDTLLFAKAQQNNESSIALSLLKNLVYEDIDLSKVTRQDVIEILMAIQGTYYTGIIDNKPYFIDENLKGEALVAKENISTASIKINDIVTKPLNKDVSVPINIHNDSLKVLFDYPRLIHDVKAREYVEEKFASEENDLAEMMQKKARNEASADELRKLDEYNQNRSSEYLKALTAQQILSYNGVVPKDIDEQIKMLHKIPVSAITLLSKILSERFNFGVQNEVSFIDNITETRITRRFDFRYTDFIPALEQRNESRFDVSFG